MQKLLVLLTLMTFVLFSCGGDDENDCTTTPATGSIDGSVFTAGSGLAEDEDDGTVFIRIYDTAETLGDDICDNFFGQTLTVIGTLPSATVGRTELFLDLSTFDGFTLTMINSLGDSPLNIVAVDGFIEVTSVTDDLIEGFMDINDGVGEDEVCGTFSLTRCP